MNIAEQSINKRTITLVLSLVLIIGGAISYNQLGRFEDPEFTIKLALVSTQYPGATPEEVEEEVTDILETAIQQMSQLKRISSISEAGLSIITVEIQDSFSKAALPQVWDELRRKVGDAQSMLPPGVQPSIVNDDFGDVYGVLYAITGDGYTMAEIKNVADEMRKELLLVQDVAKISFWGEMREVVYVELAPSKMVQSGIAPNVVISTLNRQNTVTPAGSAKVGDERIVLRPSGEFKSVKQIGDLLLSGQSGKQVYLKDVATITRGYLEPPMNIMYFNGKPALAMGISCAPGGNVVKMGRSINKKLQELMASVPIGIELNTVYFQPDLVQKSVSGFLINLLEAMGIVVVVLMIFMGVRSGVLIAVVLLLIVAGTFIIMNFFGINLQRVSLGSLIIALGMLVDNAIVIVDGIIVGMRRGKPVKTVAAAIVGQTMWPLLGATFVAVLAFAPIGASPDNTGEFCRSLFQVIMISLLLSWILAITVTPVLCSIFFKPNKIDKKNDRDPYGGLFYAFYKKILLLCLKHRFATIAVMIFALGLAVFGFGFVKNQFFPASTTPKFFINLWLTEGSDISATATVLDKFEKELRKKREVKSVAAYAGSGMLRFMLTYDVTMPNSAFGQIMVKVDDQEQIPELIKKMSEYASKEHPDILTRFKRFQIGPGGGSAIEVRFSGPDESILRSLAEKAKDVMHSEENATSITDDWRQPVKVIKPRFKPTTASRVGITREDVSTSIRWYFDGLNVGVYREKNKLLPIISRPPDTSRKDASNLMDAQVYSAAINRYIPISQAISGYDTVWQDSRVKRRNRSRVITVGCDPKEGLASPLFNKMKPKLDRIELPIGYQMKYGGEYENSQTATEGIIKILPLCLVGMILILIFLFNAIRQPLVILLTVPLAIIGVTIGLLSTGVPFGFMAILGFLSLIGMLIKNAVVLIDQIDLQIKTGKEPLKAIVDSSVSRVLPVSMAAITTVFGMLPLVFDIFFLDMSITIMFGLMFATILTLIIVPVLYALFFRVRRVT